MTGRLASLARFAPAAVARLGDVIASGLLDLASLVNQRLTSPWSGWTSACDDITDTPPTRENAGNAASQTLLCWPPTSDLMVQPDVPEPTPHHRDKWCATHGCIPAEGVR